MPGNFDPNSMVGGMKDQRGNGFANGHRQDGDFGEMGTPPEMPEGLEDMTPPEMPGDGDLPFRGIDQTGDNAEGSTEFYMQDKVNAFTGIRDAE